MAENSMTLSWRELERQSEALREAVAEQDWEAASDIAMRRHTGLQRHFHHYPVGPDTAPFYERHLARLLADEPQLQALAVQARREVMKQGLQASHNRRAVNAYHNG